MDMGKDENAPQGPILALCGGVGGAKLALGLSHILPAEQLTLVVNTGDDFEHLGLPICPDLDTVMYTLAGLGNPETGWGRAQETWSFMQAIAERGGETWFQLGDKDLAQHVQRRFLLEQGRTLSDTIREMAASLGIAPAIVPMSDQRVRTIVETEQGNLAFQHYFVRQQCAPRVTGFHFEGAADARLSPGFDQALRDPNLAGVIICPSNPFVSIGPILSLPSLTQRLSTLNAPIIAVSPIVGGQALKGPTAKMMKELGLPISPIGVADYYGDFLDGLVMDVMDRDKSPQFEARNVKVHICNTIMSSLADRKALAWACLNFLKKF